MNWITATLALLATQLLLALASPAQAIPLYNRQTGQACVACHTSPPELTPFGRRFMLGGYTMGGGKTGLPLSGFVESGFTSTAKPVDQAGPGLKRNDNAEVQKLKAYTGGAFTDSIGAFAEFVFNPIVHKAQVGNIDLRYADSHTVGGHDVLLGVTVNNNPGFQDVWNTTLVRSWPYARSAAAPRARNTMILEGQLAQRAVGAGVYGFIDDRLYLELAAYGGLSRQAQDSIGLDPADTRRILGTGLYGRVAYERQFGNDSLMVGGTGFSSDLSLPGDRAPGKDRVNSLGVDLQYQWMTKGPTDWILRAAAGTEQWDLSDSRARGLAVRDANRLSNLKVSGSWVFKKVYGTSLGFQRRWGSTDALFFGTANGKPDTTALQLDAFVINPGFMPPAWHPGLRVRLGATYTHYTSFDGARRNVDGRGRSAADNDTLFVYLYSAF